MKCMHSVTDEHKAKMTCVAEGSEVVILDADDTFPASMGPARSFRYFCPDHVGLYSGGDKVIGVTTAATLNGDTHPADCMLCEREEARFHAYTPPRPAFRYQRD